MKKYRLLKELPTFKAGEIFRFEDGNLYYYPADNGTREAHWSDKIMAYHHKTLDKFPNILEEWFEEVEEPKEYWCINEWGIIEDTDYKNDKYDNAAKEIGNYFSSKEEAEKAVEKLKAWKRLKDNGFSFERWKKSCNTDGKIIFHLDELGPRLANFRDDLNTLFGDEE